MSKSSKSLGEDKCGLDWSMDLQGLQGSTDWRFEPGDAGFHGSALGFDCCWGGGGGCGGCCCNGCEDTEGNFLGWAGAQGSTTGGELTLGFDTGGGLHGSACVKKKSQKLIFIHLFLYDQATEKA